MTIRLLFLQTNIVIVLHNRRSWLYIQLIRPIVLKNRFQSIETLEGEFDPTANIYMFLYKIYIYYLHQWNDLIKNSMNGQWMDTLWLRYHMFHTLNKLNKRPFKVFPRRWPCANYIHVYVKNLECFYECRLYLKKGATNEIWKKKL